jgi:hypothetical protein
VAESMVVPVKQFLYTENCHKQGQPHQLNFNPATAAFFTRDPNPHYSLLILILEGLSEIFFKRDKPKQILRSRI